MPEIITVEQFRKMVKKKPSLGRKKGNGDKAKSDMEMVLKLRGLAYETEYAFHATRKWRFDFAIPAEKIGIEYEGVFSEKSRHTTAKGFTGDCEKYNEAAKLGWRVLRYTAMNYRNLVNDLG